MPYKSILVHLDSSDRCADRVRLGIELAGAFDAHLVGVAVTAPLFIPGTARAEIVVRALTQEWDRRRRLLEESAEAFCGHARAAGAGMVEARAAVGDPERMLALNGRYADLIIVGRTLPEEDAVIERLVLSAGRPLLIMPHSPAGAQTGRRIMVAWDASREATRALTDALPLLKRADQVDVVTVNASPEPSGHGELPGTDIALYLARHDVRANVLQTYGEDVSVGEWLLSRASDLGSDLIVMGAYGHSRLREMVLGGATRTILASMTVPVLMSH
jgi:nucleotide-binding universal stress UspA family protein